MSRPFTLLLLSLTILVTSSYTQHTSFYRDSPECRHLNPSVNESVTSTTAPPSGQISQTIENWQAIVIILCFGIVSCFMALVHRLIRKFIFYDEHLLDTFFDAGGDVNVFLLACSVVAKYMWVSNVTQSTEYVHRYGLAGGFWYAAGGVTQLLAFSILAAEIRIKAPGAKTFLQVLKARFGTATHVIMMIFALIANVMIFGIVVMEGVQVMGYFVKGLPSEALVVIICLVVGVSTMVGGVGGGLYTAYVTVGVALSITLVWVTRVFFPDHVGGFAAIDALQNVTSCVASPEPNEARSLFTFLSEGALLRGVIQVLAGFSVVFLDQSFWQTSVAGKPQNAVWGFILGGLIWFALPFAASLALGFHYWSKEAKTGAELIDSSLFDFGGAASYSAQNLLSDVANAGSSFLMFTFVTVATLTVASSQLLAVASIIMYDIYQTYVTPFQLDDSTDDPGHPHITLRMQKALRNDAFLEYDRRCVICKHVVVMALALLGIAVPIALRASTASPYYLFAMIGLVCAGCVVPVALGITWHRITGAGVACGAIAGVTASLAAWLIYTAMFSGSLDDAETFRQDSSRDFVLVAALLVATGVGALVCVAVSLPCGGCDERRTEEEEWERARRVDNPVLPWAVKYAPNIGTAALMTSQTRGRPHFFTVRRSFRHSESVAYIIGVLLAVTIILVWPSLMLLEDVFTIGAWRGWVVTAVVWLSLAAAVAILAPLVTEVAQVCRQSYYNRIWARAEPNAGDSYANGGDDVSYSLPPTPGERQKSRPPTLHVVSREKHVESRDLSPLYIISADDAGVGGGGVVVGGGGSEVDTKSEVISTIGRSSAIDDPYRNERWKTYIHLDAKE